MFFVLASGFFALLLMFTAVGVLCMAAKWAWSKVVDLFA